MSLLNQAIARRVEIFAAVAGAAGAEDSVRAVASLLGCTELEARGVLSAPLIRFAPDAGGRPSPEPEGDRVFLRPFTATDADSSFFAQLAQDSEVTGADSGWPSERVADELRGGRFRIAQEDAAWFVSMAGDEPVGMVFGEFADGEVAVSVWIAPTHRSRGHGWRSLREARREMAVNFPGATLVVRTPIAR